MDFKAALQAFKRRVADTTVGVAYLGKIENGKRVIKDKARGGRYVFYTRQLDETVEIGSAVLADSSLIPYEEIEDFFGVEIELGYPPAKTELHVLRITAAGYTSLGGLNPLEQVLRKVSVMNLDRIGVLRVEPTIPSTLAVKIAGEYYYQSPADGAFKRFAEQNHDLSSEVSALSANQHRLALLSLDLTDNAIKVTLSGVKTHSNLPKRNAWLDSDILALNTGSWRIPIGIVYLYNGQTAIEETDILRRYQLRPIFTAAAKNNLNATANPSASNNASQGYAVGSLWRNTTNNRIWICASASQTTATWKEIAGGNFNSPTTTKGDLIVHDGTGDTRLGVGSNGQVLTADSAEPTGLKWATPSSSNLPLTDAGDLLTRDGAGLVRLPVGSQGQYLRVNTSNPTKLEWSGAFAPSGGSTIQKRVLLHEFVAVGGETGTFWTINNLNQSYRHLHIETSGFLSASSSGPSAVIMYYNNNASSANYFHQTAAFSTGGDIASGNGLPVVWAGGRVSNGGRGEFVGTLFNYATSGTTHKVFISRGSQGNNFSVPAARYTRLDTNWWANGAAITRLDFQVSANIFLNAGFTIRIYGVRDEAEPADANAVLAAPPVIGSTTPNEGRFTDIQAGAANAFYFGDPNTNGTWRIRRDGNNLVFERRVSGNYVLQFTIPAI